MTNRYDRDPDDNGFGRRDWRDQSREDDERQGQFYGQGNRQYEGSRQNQWRDTRAERHEHEQRGRSQGEGSWRDNTWREGQYGSGNFGNRDYGNRDYGGRDAGRDYGSGRDYSVYTGSDRDNRGTNTGGYYDRGERFAGDRDQRRYDRDRQGGRDYRGVYQEQVWTRDPSTGNYYGYEYSTRLDPRRFNEGDETRDRWRDVNEQNRRFDVDRGWYTPGTSGYGNRGFESHQGKGPKGYTRSDERIREDVCDRLSDDDQIDARDITVTVKNAEVILEGSVNDRRSKHRAEDVAESVSGVKDVTNQLRARKGIFKEIGDKISGDDEVEHQGHRGTGTRNSTTGTPQKTAH